MKLSPKQAQIAGLLADGHTVPEIAALLKLTEGAVRTHIARSLKKKGLQRTRQLIFYVIDKRQKSAAKNLYTKDTQAAP